MANSIDFRADSIRTGKIIASGSNGLSNPQLAIYPVANATDLRGGLSFSTASVGLDTYLYVHGDHGTTNQVVFGGDVFLSSSLKFVSGSINISDQQTSSSPYLNFVLTTNASTDTAIIEAASIQFNPAAGTTRSDSVAVSGGYILGTAGAGSSLGSTTFQGAPGGYVQFSAGRGGSNISSTTGRAGPGGSVGFYAGQGGAASKAGSTTTGGDGGSFIGYGGFGGLTVGGFAGSGGPAMLIAGNGGDVATSGSSGFGGNVLITAGAAGTGKSGAPISGGNVYLAAGSGSYDATAARFTGVGGNIFLSAAPGISTGLVAVTTGVFAVLSGIVAAYPGSPLGYSTASLDTNLVAIGTPYTNPISSRNKADNAWVTMMIVGDYGPTRDYQIFGDVVGSLLNNKNNTKGFVFFSSQSNGTLTSALAVLDGVTGSFISSSVQFPSGGVRIGGGPIADPGTGNLTVSGTTLGLGSILGLPASNPPGGITASLASNLVAFGMQYQTIFTNRDKLDQNWMSVFLYADEGSKNNNLYIGDFLNGAFGGGNPLNKSIKFYVSGATGTGQVPFARFDAVTSSFISGTMIFPSNGSVTFSGSAYLSGTTTYIGATIAKSTTMTSNFTASLFVTTYYLSASAGITCSLPSPVQDQRWEFIDVTGNAAVSPHTIFPSGSLTINNNSSYSLNRSFGGQVVVCVSSSGNGYVAVQ